MRRWLAATAVALSVATAGATAAVGEEEPAGGPLDATLTDVGPALLSPGMRLTTTIAATNTTAQPLEDVVAHLAITTEPLADRDALAEFLEDPASADTRVVSQWPAPPEGDAPGGDATNSDADEPEPSVTITPEPEPEPVGITIPGGSTSTLMVGASAVDLDLPTGEWGVYGIEVYLSTGASGGEGQTTAVATVPVTWMGEALPELDLAVLAVAGGSPQHVADAASATNLPGVTLALDPTQLSNGTVFGSQLLEREVWRLPGASPDLTSLAHAGDEVLLPLSLGLEPTTTLGDFGSASWLAVPPAVDRVTLEFGRTHGADAALALPGATGFEDLAAQTSGPVVTWNTDRSDAVLLIPDAALGEAAMAPAATDVTAVPHAIAQLALATGEAADGRALLALGPDWPFTSDGPPETLRAMLAAPWVTVIGVDALVADAPRTPVEVTAVVGVDEDLSIEMIDSLTSRMDDLQTLSTTTPSPATSFNEWGTTLLNGIDVALRGEPAAQAAAVSAAVDATEATLRSVRIASSSDLNLLAESGEIPVTVVNDLDRPVTVEVDLTSFSPNLQVQSSPTVTVPAGQEVAAHVPVEAVSSANVRVAVVLRTEDGKAVGDAQTFEIRVRADWGNAATAVFTGLLVLLLVAGIIRTVRRGRKDTRRAPGTVVDDTDEVIEDQPSADPADDAPETPREDAAHD